MKTINEIRHDFLKMLAKENLTITKVATRLQIHQSALSYFKNSKRGLGGKTLLKLLPFIYGENWQKEVSNDEKELNR